MALQINDEDVKLSVEYNCKQWCGNHSVKYNSDNIQCPVTQEEHAKVVASRVEGLVFSFDFKGEKIYGYYKSTLNNTSKVFEKTVLDTYQVSKQSVQDNISLIRVALKQIEDSIDVKT